MDKERIYKIASAALALLLWQIVSMLVGTEMLLASPVAVVKRLFALIFEKDFLKTVSYSVLRITGGFLLALVSGSLCAVLAARFRAVEILLRPYVVTVKAVPVASFIILCLIWFSYDRLAVLISFLIVFPVIYSNFLQGMKSADKALLEMAELYKVSWGKKFLFIYLPSVKPYLLSACSIAVGMAWKSGVAAEVIGVVNNSVGEKLYDAKIYFQNADLLAWTVVIVLCSVLGEKLFRELIRIFFAGIEKL